MPSSSEREMYDINGDIKEKDIVNRFASMERFLDFCVCIQSYPGRVRGTNNHNSQFAG